MVNSENAKIFEDFLTGVLGAYSDGFSLTDPVQEPEPPNEPTPIGMYGDTSGYSFAGRYTQSPLYNWLDVYFCHCTIGDF